MLHHHHSSQLIRPQLIEIRNGPRHSADNQQITFIGHRLDAEQHVSIDPPPTTHIKQFNVIVNNPRDEIGSASNAELLA